MNRTKQLIISLLTLLCCSTGAWAEGELKGLFTVNAGGDKVQFSQGNLQATYDGSDWTWARLIEDGKALLAIDPDQPKGWNQGTVL